MTLLTGDIPMEAEDKPTDAYTSGYGDVFMNAAQRSFLGTTRDITEIGDFSRAKAPTLDTARTAMEAGDKGAEFALRGPAHGIGTLHDFGAGASAPEPPSMPIADAQKRVKDAGLEKALKLPDQPAIREGVLDLMINHARDRQQYESVLARAPAGGGALDFATSMAVGLLDPSNVALSFVPVIGELRYAKLMASAGESVLARAAMRGGIGAAQGAVFTAATGVPVEAWLASQEGRDYTMSEALHQIILGGATFGAMHVVGGGVADVYRRRSGRALFPYGVRDPLGRTEPAAAAQRLAGEVLDVEPQIADILGDLPYQAKEDLMRGAIGQLIEGRPVVAAEHLDHAAAVDPRLTPHGGREDFVITDPLGAARDGETMPVTVLRAADGTIDALLTPHGVTKVAPAYRGMAPEQAIAETFGDHPQGGTADAAKVRPATAPEAHGPALPARGERAVFDDVLAQLRAAGMPADQAEANARIVAARYATRAARLGMDDVWGLYHGEGLAVRGPEDLARGPSVEFGSFRTPEGEAVLAQPGFEQPPLRVPPEETSLTRQYEAAAERAGMGGGTRFVDLGEFPIRDAGDIGGEGQRYVVERGRATGVEHMVAVDAAGEVILHGHGTRTFVGTNPTFMALIADPAQSLVIHHNHPANSGLSIADVAMLAYPGLRAVWAHGHLGSVSRVTLTPAARAVAPEPATLLNKISAAMRKAGSAIFDRLQKAVWDHKISPDEAQAIHTALVSEMMDRAGIVDYRSNIEPAEAIVKYGLGYDIEEGTRAAAREVFGHEQIADVFDDRRSESLRHVGELGASFGRTPEAAGGHAAPGAVDLFGRRDPRLQAPSGERAPEQLRLLEGERGFGEERERFIASPFYSAIERAVSAAKQERAAPEQWLAMLKNTPGIKAEEMEWLGLADWLKEQKGPVTRQAIADYVRANRIEVREAEKGEHIPTAHAVVERAKDLADMAGERWASLDPDRRRMYEDDALASLREEGESTRYPQYVLPGGRDYRELLLTLPEERETPQIAQLKARAQELDDKLVREGLTWDESDEKGRLLEQITNAEQSRNDFRGSHWEEPNVLAHVRFNDRTIGGKHTLFIEEIQSDWHQKGRREGYRNADVIRDLQEKLRPLEEAKTAELDRLEAQNKAVEMLQDFRRDPRYDTLPLEGKLKIEEAITNLLTEDSPVAKMRELRETMAEFEAAVAREHMKVPDAPFKTTWPDLVLKRMIRYAAEHDYDQIAWAPGEVQAERYDLSKRVDSIYAYKNEDGTFSIFAVPVGHTISDNIPIAGGLRADQIAEHVGKDLADKIAAQPVGERKYSDVDLKVGGEGMRGFYDKMLPAAANKLVKKFGAKVGEGYIRSGRPAEARTAIPPELRDALRDADYLGFDRAGDALAALRADRNAGRDIRKEWDLGRPQDEPLVRAIENYLDGTEARTPVHTLPLTDALREAALSEGFPLFQSGEAGPRGRIMLAENRAIVDLFKTADASTFMHEMGHKWLEELIRDARRAGGALEEDLGTVLRWLGVDKPGDIGVAHHEQFARAFEAYLAEGKAPSARLAAVFERFKEWLAAVYRAIVGSGGEVSDEIRGVMGRLLATDEEIRAQRGETEQAASPSLPSPASEGGGESGASGGGGRETEDSNLPPAIEVRAKAARGPRARDPGTWSLLEFLASRGGISPEERNIGDLHTIFGRKNKFVPGFGNVIRKGGMTLDRAREAAVGAGYLHDEGNYTGGLATSTINDLLEAIDRENRGDRVYRAGHERTRAREYDPGEHMHHLEGVLDQALEEAEMKPSDLDSKLRARVLEIMAKEGENDPHAALERAVMEESYSGDRRGEAEALPEPIPGWDVPDDAGAAPAGGEGAGGVAAAGAPQTRAGARGAGARDRAAEIRRAATAPGPADEPAAVAASRAAEREAEPGSIYTGEEDTPSPRPSPRRRGEGAQAPERAASKRTKAAQAEEAQANAAFEDAARGGFLSEEEIQKVNDAIAAIDADVAEKTSIWEQGAACLARAVG